jgi:hypothetical protein
MPDTMIERVARALYRSAPHDYDPNQMGEDETWPDLVDPVRAVLNSMREPTEAMLANGERLEVFASCDWDGSSANVMRDVEGGSPGLQTLWRTMIDAALAEEG